MKTSISIIIGFIILTIGSVFLTKKEVKDNKVDYSVLERQKNCLDSINKVLDNIIISKGLNHKENKESALVVVKDLKVKTEVLESETKKLSKENNTLKKVIKIKDNQIKGLKKDLETKPEPKPLVKDSVIEKPKKFLGIKFGKKVDTIKINANDNK